MLVLPNTTARVFSQYGEVLDDSAVTFVRAATTGTLWVLDSISIDYSDVSINRQIIVDINSVVVFDLDIVTTGPRQIVFPRGLYGAVDQEMVATITSPVAGNLRTSLHFREFFQAEPNTVTPQLMANDKPAADTAAVVTLAAAATDLHVIDAIYWSYGLLAPTAGNLLVTIGGSTAYSADITAAGDGSVSFPHGLFGDFNEEVVVTLAAPGGVVDGRLNVSYR